MPEGEAEKLEPTLAREATDPTIVDPREARVAGCLEHPSIVPVHALGRDDEGEAVIVMIGEFGEVQRQ